MRKSALAVVVTAGAAVAVVAVGAALAKDDNRNVNAKLGGYAETPSVSTHARGEFRAKIDRDKKTIAYELSYRDLDANATQAHIHFGARDVAGGVIAFLCGGGDKPSCPATQGTVKGTIDTSDVIGPVAQGIEAGAFDEAVAAIRGGVVYANVHSTKFPSGEIRGQLGGGKGKED